MTTWGLELRVLQEDVVLYNVKYMYSAYKQYSSIHFFLLLLL